MEGPFECQKNMRTFINVFYPLIAMRQQLIDLIKSTIIYKYDLPYTTGGISKTIYSTDNDKCFMAGNDFDVAEIIYNSIIEYSFNEFDLTQTDFGSLHAIALKNKLRFNEYADEETKLKYGFFGEVMLYCILLVHFQAKPLIARGYFYNPLENAETKGYDSYQLVENNGKTELWFGEVKFHVTHSSCIKSVFENIDKALSDQYLEKNVFSIHNHKNNLNITGSKIEKILKAWEQNPSLTIASELKKHDMKLVYPILLLYEGDATDYDKSIQMIPQYITDNHTGKNFTLSIDYSIFFILLPVSKVKDIKTNVIQWIESKRPLLF